jgi:LTXXQ motif family protein
MKLSNALAASFLATSLALGGPALAQQSQGMKPSEMPSGGMSGDGMMGGGMMGGGMMGHMMQSGMMGRDCPMMGMTMGRGDGSTHAAGRIAFLKAELGITDAQQAAFDDYAAALKTNLEGMQAMRSSMMSAMQSGKPGDRLDVHIKAMEGRLAALKEVKPALDKLYASLSDEQKKKADQILTGMGCMM